MIKTKTSIKISIGVCFTLAAVLFALVLFGPKIFELYMTVFRGFAVGGSSLEMLSRLFKWCFYPSAVFSAVILYALIKLLFNILNEKVFIKQNAKYLKTVSYCLLIVGMITFAGGFFYMPFMFVAAAGLFTGMMLRVLKNVFQSAVELREESDLTI